MTTDIRDHCSKQRAYLDLTTAKDVIFAHVGRPNACVVDVADETHGFHLSEFVELALAMAPTRPA
jgi:hypothetical protein